LPKQVPAQTKKIDIKVGPEGRRKVRCSTAHFPDEPLMKINN